MKVLLVQANNPSVGTNIDLAGTNSANKETELFYVNRKINEDLEEITKDKPKNSEIINIISNFQIIGKKMNSPIDYKAFQLAVLFSLGVIGFLLLLELNNYLNTLINKS